METVVYQMESHSLNFSKADNGKYNSLKRYWGSYLCFPDNVENNRYVYICPKGERYNILTDATFLSLTVGKQRKTIDLRQEITKEQEQKLESMEIVRVSGMDVLNLVREEEMILTYEQIVGITEKLINNHKYVMEPHFEHDEIDNELELLSEG